MKLSVTGALEFSKLSLRPTQITKHILEVEIISIILSDGEIPCVEICEISEEL